MSIQREFVLRHRAAGFIRFQVPARICDADVAKVLTDDVLAIDGVYRVSLYRGQKKLSIHFHESVCDFHALARQLFDLLKLLEDQGLLTPKPPVQVNASSGLKNAVKDKLAGTKWGQWGKEQYTAAKETIQAAKIVGKVGMKHHKTGLMKNPEQTIIDFLNDILILYLIKLHWHNITQHWIINPIKHRYEWSAVFYMFYLLMRSRRPK